MDDLQITTSQLWLNIGLIAVLFAMLKLRLRVTPRISVSINATPEKVFQAIDIVDGKSNDLGRSKVAYTLLDAATQLFRFTYTTTLVGGRERTFEAKFRIAERIPGRLMRLERAGLEGKSQNNELLEITQEISPEADGSRLTTQYNWGPRPFLAQLLARTDLWGGVRRLKGAIETGIPNERAHNLMTATIGIGTGLITLGTFWWVLGFDFSIAISAIIVLLVHEFGHLLAFRMVGQPWGRMMFLPFLGAIAMPRLPFETHAEGVFSALMGPGLSVLICIACALWINFGNDMNNSVAMLGLIAAAINLFNILPIEPLDGGIALRPIFAKIAGERAQWVFIGAGLLTVLLGIFLGQFIVAVFGLVAILGNTRKRPVSNTLPHLTSRQAAAALGSYILMTSAYIAFLASFSKASTNLAMIGT